MLLIFYKLLEGAPVPPPEVVIARGGGGGTRRGKKPRYWWQPEEIRKVLVEVEDAVEEVEDLPPAKAITQLELLEARLLVNGIGMGPVMDKVLSAKVHARQAYISAPVSKKPAISAAKQEEEEIKELLEIL